ncbi:TetR family transcriptional regulator, partial [Escherichia coli]|nr:TetR family transcriptional regulator [Escherichia coli]
MPRPKLKSDDEVLEAATVVLKRCGPIEFTLSGVAKEVGLSRAALIQRFTNRDTLLVRMMERGVEQVRHYLNGHCCKVSDEAAFCLIQRPYISKTLL